jgi:hypothetical protein
MYNKKKEKASVIEKTFPNGIDTVEVRTSVPDAVS